jgi:hypothetical protein
MVEATSSLTQTQRLAQRQAQAVRVLCEWQAQEEIKERIRKQGKIKLSKVPRSQLVRMARTALMEDAAYRARLIVDAKRMVEQWRVEGFFGKQAALSVRKGPELRTLAISEGHEEREIQQ